MTREMVFCGVTVEPIFKTVIADAGEVSNSDTTFFPKPNEILWSLKLKSKRNELDSKL